MSTGHYEYQYVFNAGTVLADGTRALSTAPAPTV
jgi:hypothetical protein